MAKGDVQTVALLVVADTLERVDLESLEYRLDRREPFIPVRQSGDHPDECRKTIAVSTRAPTLNKLPYLISVTEIPHRQNHSRFPAALDPPPPAQSVLRAPHTPPLPPAPQP